MIKKLRNNVYIASSLMIKAFAFRRGGLPERTANFLAMKLKFYFAFENFENMQIEKGKLKMKNSTTCLKNATLFCNNSSFCVHFCPLDILD